MNRVTKVIQVQIQRRGFLRLLGALGLGILALPAVGKRPGPADLSLREATFYRKANRRPAGR
jgi:hypothetical protein